VPCSKSQGPGGLPPTFHLDTNTHLVWVDMGHMRSPPRMPPQCHSSPPEQSVPAGGSCTGKEATDTCEFPISLSVVHRDVLGNPRSQTAPATDTHSARGCPLSQVEEMSQAGEEAVSQCAGRKQRKGCLLYQALALHWGYTPDTRSILCSL
jgi:hypothetical protein